jgi:hypothetical protein
MNKEEKKFPSQQTKLISASIFLGFVLLAGVFLFNASMERRAFVCSELRKATTGNYSSATGLVRFGGGKLEEAEPSNTTRRVQDLEKAFGITLKACSRHY